MKGDRPKFRFLLTNHDSGQLSIDFIVGLSIFMVALIVASTMASSLLVGLQSKHIDYDAVAYRTAVMLVEDPGEPVQRVGYSAYTQPYGEEQWELVEKTGEKLFTKRFGLAVSKSTPAIISSKKYERFMDSSLYSREDYQNKLLFSDYPYNYNITIRKKDGTLKTIGDAYHENSQYGYIRRIVLEKESGTISVKLSDFYFPGQGDGKLTVEISTRDFLNSIRSNGPTYTLDPYREDIKVNLSFNGVNPNPDPVTGAPIPFKLKDVQCEYNGTGIKINTTNFVYQLPDGNKITPPDDIGFPDYMITNLGRVLNFDPIPSEDNPIILITYDFGDTADISGREFSDASDYTGPQLVPAWMEVRIW